MYKRQEIDIQDTLELANDYVNMPFDAAEAEKEGKTESFEEKYKDRLREDVMKYLSDNRAHRALWKGVPISRDGKVQLRDGRTGEPFDTENILPLKVAFRTRSFCSTKPAITSS